ncbi:MAG: hypothetical protein ACMG6S_08515, partial [Byssovorax sp.]
MAVAQLPPPRDLTLPEPGSTTARAVLSAAMRRLVRDLQMAAARAPHGARDEAGELARVVSATARDAPGAL